MDIRPARTGITVGEVREHVADLIRANRGEPGEALLGLVYGMLKYTECHCEPPTGHRDAVVLQLVRPNFDDPGRA